MGLIGVIVRSTPESVRIVLGIRLNVVDYGKQLIRVMCKNEGIVKGGDECACFCMCGRIAEIVGVRENPTGQNVATSIVRQYDNTQCT